LGALLSPLYVVDACFVYLASNTFKVIPPYDAMSTTISAKIPEKLKEKADKYGLKIGPLVRDALEAKIRDIERQALSTSLAEICNKLGPKIRKEDVVKAVRQSRNER
jgi:hypothetical protein